MPWANLGPICDWPIYWEKLVKGNGWINDVAPDTLMLSLRGDKAVYIHRLNDFNDFSQVELLYRLEERFALTLADGKHQLHHQQKPKNETYEPLAQDIMGLSNCVYRAGDQGRF